jgi:hypothetical protein
MFGQDSLEVAIHDVRAHVAQAKDDHARQIRACNREESCVVFEALPQYQPTRSRFGSSREHWAFVMPPLQNAVVLVARQEYFHSASANRRYPLAA